MSGSDDLGGLGDLDDGDDLGGLDDEGEFGDLSDDGFGEMEGGDEMAGGGGGNVDELEHRLDELENEVGSLSSTVNTVRNENEQISESVQDVEENVRKLLDIYEMVTRGVNPFADEMDAGMGMGGMDAQDSSFGLFTDDEEQAEEESVDDDIADADAEGFFDDDLVDDDEGMDDEFGAMEETEEASSDDSGGGTSFEDLKDEYESGEADWDDEGTDEFDEVGDDLDDDFDEVTDGFDDADDADDGFEEVGEDLGDDELFDETVDSGEADDGTAAAEPEPTTAETVETTTETTATTGQTTGSASTGESGGKPYVATLPEGFASDLIVVEWLEYLVDEAGVRETSKAIDYYETVGWISEDVADRMDTYLRGFQDTGRGSLRIDHHKQSLDFINQLNGGGAVQPTSGSMAGLQR